MFAKIIYPILSEWISCHHIQLLTLFPILDTYILPLLCKYNILLGSSCIPVILNSTMYENIKLCYHPVSVINTSTYSNEYIPNVITILNYTHPKEMHFT